MPEQSIDGRDWIDDLETDLADAIDGLCRDIVGDEKFRLSRQAVNTRGGGEYIARGIYDYKESSVQGEPPRRRSGRLQASIEYAVLATLGSITATLSTDTPYAGWLVDNKRLILTDRVDGGDLARDFVEVIAKTI